jgi:CBS domain-containing protein
VAASADLPALFVDLLDAGGDAPALTSILTVLNDAMTLRLIEMAIDRLGEPPVAYAWLVFGSAARNELTLASDQDNGLAYDDSDDSAVPEYFRLLATDVNEGLGRCGFAIDPHGTVAQNWKWRLPLSKWRAVFSRSLEDRDPNRLARASIAFDFRQLAGDLAVPGPLTEIMREAPSHHRFMSGLADLGTHNPMPLYGLRQRVAGKIDVKKECLLPIRNFARYHAFAAGISAHSTLDRLRAAQEAGVLDADTERSLREAFISMLDLQLRHHADAVRAGRPLDNIIDVETLRPLTRATFQEALRVVASTQHRFRRPPALH